MKISIIILKDSDRTCTSTSLQKKKECFVFKSFTDPVLYWFSICWKFFSSLKKALSINFKNCNFKQTINKSSSAVHTHNPLKIYSHTFQKAEGKEKSALRSP